MNDDTNSKQKTLNERIEDLVNALERLENLASKKFSVRAALLRGVAQGLGIIIGSTIVAGILYAVLVKFISPQLINQFILENVVERSLKEK